MEVVTPYVDLWFEIGTNGERIPMYFSRLEEEAAIEAFLAGDWGSLMADEIEFMKSAMEINR